MAVRADGAGAAAGRPGGPLAAVRPVVSARTWLALIHLLAGWFIGIAVFTIAVSGVAAGIGLVPAFLAGLPVLALTLWLCNQFARAERARFALLLGSRIPGPPPAPPGRSWWSGMLHILISPVAWRHFCYTLVRLVLSTVQVTIAVTVWSVGLAMVAAPFYNSALPGGGAHLGALRLHGAGELATTAAVGLVILLMAPPVTRALAAVDAWTAGWLIGGPGRAELTARIGELETSRARVVDAAEAERRRIERDLHDGAQQRLVSLAMELGRARAKFATDPDGAAAIVGQAHDQAKEALAELRDLVRGVHPPVLSDRGLDAALSGLAARSPVPVTVRVDVDARPPAAVEAIAYFVVAEALTNVAKHAHASHADVTVRRTGSQLTVVISDDGAGGADPAGQGLSGLADRVHGVDGRMSVTSPPGGPTSIEVMLPCE